MLWKEIDVVDIIRMMTIANVLSLSQRGRSSEKYGIQDSRHTCHEDIRDAVDWFHAEDLDKFYARLDAREALFQDRTAGRMTFDHLSVEKEQFE